MTPSEYEEYVAKRQAELGPDEMMLLGGVVRFASNSQPGVYDLVIGKYEDLSEPSEEFATDGLAVVARDRTHVVTQYLIKDDRLIILEFNKEKGTYRSGWMWFGEFLQKAVHELPLEERKAIWKKQKEKLDGQRLQPTTESAAQDTVADA